MDENQQINNVEYATKYIDVFLSINAARLFYHINDGVCTYLNLNNEMRQNNIIRFVS